MKYFVFLSLIFSLLYSCAPTKKRSEPIRYSQEVEEEFASIERQKAIERYRRLRAKNWNKYVRRRRKANKKRTSKNKKKAITRKKVLRYKKVDPVEQSKEIEQHMAIFCMTHRKNVKFRNEEDCVNQTQNYYINCLEKFSRDNRDLYKCVKSRLRI